MKGLVQKYVGVNLVLKIAVGLAIGVIAALVAPGFTLISLFGDIFVGALKSVAPILVFVLVICSLSNAGKGIGSRFRTVIILYMVSTFLAAILAVIASKLFPVTLVFKEATEGSAPSGISEVLRTFFTSMVTNPVKAIAEANYIAVLTWAVVFGIAIKTIATDATKEVLQNISDAISKSVQWIIQLAPFGIMGLVFTAVSTNGLDIFAVYGKLLAVLVGCMLFGALVINPFIVFLSIHKNPYPLVLRCLRESGVTAFFTRSSAANIPVNMALCEKLGLDRDMYSVSIPLGATINMDGAAVTITIMTLATANTLGITVDIPTAILLSIIAALGACGSSGVAGGSLLLIPMACSLFGIPNDVAMQTVGVGFVIGVIQDSFETALNSSGDVVFAATAEFRERIKKGIPVKF